MSSIAANAATAPPRGEGAADDLRLRLLSVLVLAPIALAALLWNATAFAILMGAAGLIMSWEWDRLRTGRFGTAGLIGAAAVAIGGVFALLGYLSVGGFVALSGAVIAYYAIRISREREAELAALGVLIVSGTAISLIWLRSSADGLALAGWLVGTVWATDIGAYAVGKTLGGPKLAPRLSPGKTWAGLAGGVALAAGWGAAFGLIWTGGAGRSAVLAAATAVLAQIGDLVISAVKRHYGAKDSSNIIPGHGGVLDRLAGLIVTAPAMALMVTIGGFAPWR